MPAALQHTAALPEQSHLRQRQMAGQARLRAPSGLTTAGQPSLSPLPLPMTWPVNLGHWLQASANSALNEVKWVLTGHLIEARCVGSWKK